MVLHDITLGLTTDVATKFPERYAKNAAGEPVSATGTVVAFANRVWMPKDFTRAEIQTLLLNERYSTATTPRTVSHTFDGKVGTVPTFEEAIQFVQSEERRLRKVIGIYPETKSPQRHRDWGLPMEDELLRVLNKYGYVDRNSPVFIQSFEDTNLMALKKKTDMRLIQLISGSSTTVPFGNTYSYGDMITTEGLARIASYAYGIGPSQTMVVSEATGIATDLAKQAHAVGLKVHSYTVRNDALPPYILALGYVNVGYPGEGTGGYKQMKDLLAAGVDGMFTDFDNTLYPLCKDNGWR
jgi:glycerophosphoryl diester phosphodiesterase